MFRYSITLSRIFISEKRNDVEIGKQVQIIDKKIIKLERNRRIENKTKAEEDNKIFNHHNSIYFMLRNSLQVSRNVAKLNKSDFKH